MKGLPSSLKFEWMKGNVNNPTRLQEQLNSRSHILATEHQESTNKGKDIEDMLPA